MTKKNEEIVDQSNGSHIWQISIPETEKKAKRKMIKGIMRESENVKCMFPYKMS